MTNNNPQRPNLFNYATSELSQDAVICWLVACAAEATGDLQECGRAFVRALFRAGVSDGIEDVTVLGANGEPTTPYDGPCYVSDVSNIRRQCHKIDVYFQAKVDEKRVSFIIEDKTYTEYHSCQLARYIEDVSADDERKDIIKPVYFKTGYVFSNERDTVERTNYSVFKAEDMKRFLDGQDATRKNEILRQYAEYLACQMKTRADAQANWDLNQDHVQWKFMLKLSDRLENADSEWRPFIPDELSGYPPISDWLWRRVGRGGSWGRPWTHYWFARHLFWRLDSEMPLRLMIDREQAGSVEGSGGMLRNYRNCFGKALQEEELSDGGVNVKQSRGNQCTVGSVEITNFQGMTVSEFLDRVTRVHIRFLDMIDPTG